MRIRNIAVYVLLTLLAFTYAAAQSAADQKELYDYVLTMDKAQKIATATQALQPLSKQHPQLTNQGDAKSIDESVQNFQKYPDAVAIVGKQGMKPREYIVGMMVLLQVNMAVGFKKQGAFKDYPPDMLKMVSKANLDFGEKNWDKLQAMGKN